VNNLSTLFAVSKYPLTIPTL